MENQNENIRTIEINGIKLEVDLRTAKRIDQFKVGDNVKVLKKNGGNFQGVPVTDIAGELILGFDRPKLEDALRKNSLISE